MPTNVLTSERISAPPSTAARAVTRTSVTLGESFTISGKRVALRLAAVIAASAAASLPKIIPPCSVLGHETFNSIAATPSA